MSDIDDLVRDALTHRAQTVVVSDRLPATVALGVRRARLRRRGRTAAAGTIAAAVVAGAAVLLLHPSPGPAPIYSDRYGHQGTAANPKGECVETAQTGAPTRGPDGRPVVGSATEIAAVVEAARTLPSAGGRGPWVQVAPHEYTRGAERVTVAPAPGGGWVATRVAVTRCF